MRLIYHPDAELELVGAAAFYKQQVPTLVAQFIDATERGINDIQEAPEGWMVLEDERMTPGSGSSCPANGFLLGSRHDF